MLPVHRRFAWRCFFSGECKVDTSTLQQINISHLGKRKIIFNMLFLGDMLVPWRVFHLNFYPVFKVVNSWFVWPDWFRKNWITASEWISGICSCSQGERWSSIKNPISIQALPLYSRDIACVSKYPLAHWYYPTFTGPIEAGTFNVGGLPVILMGSQTKKSGYPKKNNHPHYVTFTNILIPLETHMTLPLRHDLPGLARPADEREDRTLRTHLCCFERSGNWWVLTDVTI